MPSGVQLSSPIVPPGRQTRTSSSAATWWNGANMTPMQDITMSNEAVLERQVLRVGRHPLDVQALGFGSTRACLEQSWGEVGGDHLGAAPGGRDRGVAGAGGDVEDAVRRE